MKKYIFLLTCLLSTSMLMAQCPKSSSKRCFKAEKCKKQYTSSCEKKTMDVNEECMLPNTKKWRIGAIGLNIGSFTDHYQSMTVEGMKSMAIDLPNVPVDLNGLNMMGDESSVVIEGASLGAYISLNPRNRTRDGHNLNQELRIGFSTNIDREAMIQFSDNNYENSVIYCLIESEVMLSAQYLFSGQFGRRFGFYGGAGMNVGSTFNNLFLLIEDGRDSNGFWESSTTEVAAKSSYYTRGFLSAGLMYHTLGRVSLSLDIQSGVGLQVVNGAKNNYISDICAGQLGVQYRFLK